VTYCQDVVQFILSSLQLAYAIEVLDKDDPYIQTAERALSSLEEAGNPGAFLVDTLPICSPLSLTQSKFFD
jgi:hypothetical protein